MNAVVLTVKACYVASTKVSVCLVCWSIAKIVLQTVKAYSVYLSQKLVWVWSDVREKEREKVCECVCV